jgi:hypothetical protein
MSGWGKGRKSGKIDVIGKESEIFDLISVERIHNLAQTLTAFEVLRLGCLGEGDRVEFLLSVLPTVYEEKKRTPEEEKELQGRLDDIRRSYQRTLRRTLGKPSP